MKPTKRKAIETESKRMSKTVEKLEFLKASVRSKVEHQFRIIQVSVWLSQDSVQRTGQKHHANRHAVCVEQRVVGEK